jgi:two-component system sensor histidine kinase YesM
MRLIEQGDLSITIKQTSSDEIGHLIQAFGHMMERLKHLINEVLKSRITQQEYEMKALQAQINPHFLYNSLSLINGKAIIAGQDDISQMARLLSTFYRTTLNKGKNLISVRDELENTRSYAEIQRMMHSNSFDIVYDIDESVYSFSMPNLLLQPLVENSILHGIDHKETSDRGVLTIFCRRNDQMLIFKVLDNGCGMSAEQCENILTSESSGYGIQNVHHRVQLYYGTEYGLRYTSTKGVGTCATLTLCIINQAFL